MSLDIASSVANLPARASRIEDLIAKENDVFAFDFDGVVIGSDEDDIYHLLSWQGEDDLLAEAARKFRVRCDGMERKYQRHLLFQAAAYMLHRPIDLGVGFNQAKAAAEVGRLFLLTARSGWYAVERMRLFLKDHEITPIEVFNLGRVKKDRQLDLLCREFPGVDVYYIEDNKAHLSAVESLEHDNLNLVWAPRSTPKRDEAELRNMVIETIQSAIDL